MKKIENKLQPSEFESKWQKAWEEKGVYQPDLANAKKPFYNLMMFPYPSAEGLHVGNMYAFTGADIYGRFKRMQGNDVFEPIGLDGFGIHSENYAIKLGKHPAEQAVISEKNFYRQMHAIGNGFAWRNTVETYDPDYYRWTQWIFVQMFKHGLAYRKKSPVNFCPSCKTVLSDEQVIDGSCERCKSQVEKRQMEQWFFKITAYAEKLLGNLETLNWTNKVKLGQKNWIGKSEGVNFRFKVKDLDIYFEMFDSVPQTHMAQTFTVIAPEHPELFDLVKGTTYEKPVMDFVEKIKKKKISQKFDLEKEPEGIFTGRYIEYTPAKRLLPIWVASFVIVDYGTGVVNASAHDERDFVFAKKYNLPLHPVMFPKDPKDAAKVKNLEYCYHHAPEGILEEPQEFRGRKWGEVRKDVIEYIEKKGFGKCANQYHLRDWLISRQRYWGAPIPMIFCESCAEKGIGWLTLKRVGPCKGPTLFDSMPGWFPVPDDQLPVLLPPDVADWKPEGTGKGPLAKIESFVKVKCPKCGEDAERETDVCDTFLDSSWYFLRYPSVKNNVTMKQLNNETMKGKLEHCNIGKLNHSIPWDRSVTQKWLPVDIYIGGAEHTVLHLLYSRFVTMAFRDFGLIDFDEPFSRFYAHGLIIAEGAKMSKSRGNVIIPDEYIRAYGADTLRTYLMFLGPFDMGGDFRDTGIAGMYRFLSRVWRLVNDYIKHKTYNIKQDSDKDTSGVALSDSEGDSPDGGGIRIDLIRVMHRTIKEVTEDLENLRYNTAISHIMVYVNFLEDNRQQTTDNIKHKTYNKEQQNINSQLATNLSAQVGNQQPAKEAIKTLLLLLAPFAPHMTEELWHRLQVSDKDTSGVVPIAIGNSSDGLPAQAGGGICKDYHSIHQTSWPSFDTKYLIEDEVTIVVQINGKTRETIKVQSTKCKVQSVIEEEAKKSEKVKKHLEGKPIRKVIYIPGKLINFVI